MRRDPDLVRAILLAVEAHGTDTGWPVDVYRVLTNYDADSINYHVHLLAEAKYITAILNVKGALPSSLTWAGHELLDATRDEKVWAEVKRRLGPVGSFTLEIIGELAKSVILQALTKNQS